MNISMLAGFNNTGHIREGFCSPCCLVVSFVFSLVLLFLFFCLLLLLILVLNFPFSLVFVLFFVHSC